MEKVWGQRVKSMLPRCMKEWKLSTVHGPVPAAISCRLHHRWRLRMPKHTTSHHDGFWTIEARVMFRHRALSCFSARAGLRTCSRRMYAWIPGRFMGLKSPDPMDALDIDDSIALYIMATITLRLAVTWARYGIIGAHQSWTRPPLRCHSPTC